MHLGFVTSICTLSENKMALNTTSENWQSLSVVINAAFTLTSLTLHDRDLFVFVKLHPCIDRECPLPGPKELLF